MVSATAGVGSIQIPSSSKGYETRVAAQTPRQIMQGASTGIQMPVPTIPIGNGGNGTCLPTAQDLMNPMQVAMIDDLVRKQV